MVHKYSNVAHCRKKEAAVFYDACGDFMRGFWVCLLVCFTVGMLGSSSERERHEEWT